jgi:hypothetical protein
MFVSQHIVDINIYIYAKLILTDEKFIAKPTKEKVLNGKQVC